MHWDEPERNDWERNDWETPIITPAHWNPRHDWLPVILGWVVILSVSAFCVAAWWLILVVVL